MSRPSRPRGRPFPKGTSGNPGGRPHNSDCLSACLREVASQPAGGGLTHAQRLARVMFKRAEAGDMRAAALIADRLEGRPGQRLEVAAGGEVAPLIINLGESLSESYARMHTHDIPRAGEPER
jgi:hypothetical protein